MEIQTDLFFAKLAFTGGDTEFRVATDVAFCAKTKGTTAMTASVSYPIVDFREAMDLKGGLWRVARTLMVALDFGILSRTLPEPCSENAKNEDHKDNGDHLFVRRTGVQAGEETPSSFLVGPMTQVTVLLPEEMLPVGFFRQSIARIRLRER